MIGSQYGTFSIELDAVLFNDKTYEQYLKTIGIDLNQLSIRTTIEDVLDHLASVVIPYEVVTPPIPLTELESIEELKCALHAHQALGSKASFIYAFGLHINPEAPSQDARMLLGYLRSFLLLYDWIVEESQIDLSRRIAPFFNEFPDAFVRMVLDPEYVPNDIEQFIDDYLHHTPTRNRPLDFLPLLAHIDEDKVMDRARERALIKPRPAFHYRLPNCLIDDPAWTIAREWNYWVEVEKLAANPSQIRTLSEQFLVLRDTRKDDFQRSWLEEVKTWVT